MMQDGKNDTSSLTEIFGEPIHTYTRAQALEDGTLVDVSELAREAGFRLPVAMTRTVWEDCVAWSGNQDIHQDETGRLHDILWKASLAARRGLGRRVTFQIYRVPNDGRSKRAKLVLLDMHIGPGDTADPVITITMPGED
jgi:hypothetical protein